MGIQSMLSSIGKLNNQLEEDLANLLGYLRPRTSQTHKLSLHFHLLVLSLSDLIVIFLRLLAQIKELGHEPRL